MTIDDFKRAFDKCDDVQFKEIFLPALQEKCYVIYTEVILSNVFHLALEERKSLPSVEEAVKSFLAGNVLVFSNNKKEVYTVSDRGYPGLGVSDADDEKVLRGSNEAFCDSIKTNTALIRKRLRTTDLKVKEEVVGVRTTTNISILYMQGIAQDRLVQGLQERLEQYSLDGVLDSGVIEQLIKKQWKSPFPEVQTTRRPDKATYSLLEGRIILLCDNSPVALIIPTDIGSLLKTADDYYNSYFMSTVGRIIRYMATFLSYTLPGLYLVMTNYHTQILPTPLLLSFQEARSGVPFPAALEIVLMEVAFELLREAGVRLPDVMGNTIGIVGGLIIGQAAVEANLVSPIVVILVALTALCSFAIPDEELSFAFRILKFFVLLLSAFLGLYGFFAAQMVILIHLSKLNSYGIPYLMPFAAADKSHGENYLDGIWRAPYRFLRKRPVFSKRSQRIRLRKEKK